METDKKNGITDNTTAFEEIITIIERARENAFRAVNHELISMYWEIGNFISKKVSADNWGKSIVKEFSQYIQSRFVGIKGFSPQNIWRMKQFYETYVKSEKLSPLVREISWTNNVLIIMAAKTDEEREFYSNSILKPSTVMLKSKMKIPVWV
jgi:predicted nuclease of restriction endonuclease-like (RecB) superfamily